MEKGVTLISIGNIDTEGRTFLYFREKVPMLRFH
jgi:hypothetical protein